MIESRVRRFRSGVGDGSAWVPRCAIHDENLRFDVLFLGVRGCAPGFLGDAIPCDLAISKRCC